MPLPRPRDRLEHRLALVQGLLVLGLRVAVRHDATPDLEVDPAAAYYHRTDRDIYVVVAVKPQAADAARIDAPLGRLEFVDYLHRSYLRSPRNGATRKSSPEQVNHIPSLVQVSNDGRDQVMDGSVTVSYTHLRAHETRHDLVCRLLLENKKKKKKTTNL